LQSVCEQDLDRSLFETLVVDNNSTDDTRAVVERFAAEYPNVHYYLEERQGLSHARNRGWREARGSYVGYIDDDAKAPPGWLNIALRIIRERRPALFGGPYYPFYRTPKPDWFKDDYGTREIGYRERFLTASEDLSGGNLFVRRDVCEKLGGFNPRLGMKGKTIAYGEETAFQAKLIQQMPEERIWYDPALRIFHLVSNRKMRVQWRLRQQFAQGRYSYRLLGNSAVQANGVASGVRQVVRTLKRFARSATIDAIQRDHEQYPYFRSFVYEHSAHYLYTCGRYFEYVVARIPKGGRHRS